MGAAAFCAAEVQGAAGPNVLSEGIPGKSL